MESGNGVVAFGHNLRRLREAAGLTQEDLAWKAGLSPKAVSLLERGERRRPYPRTVHSLADALHLGDLERAALLASVPSRAGSEPPEETVGTATALPVSLTPLIGRESELEAICATVTSRAARLLTLTGPGGVGKTRLAIEAASRSASNFSDGAAFVALAPLQDPRLVPTAMLRGLGLAETPGVRALDKLEAYLSDRSLLLLLDNFEHLMSAAADLAKLLSSSPEVTLLVTSRAPLRLRGEREWLVPPLAVPDPSRPADHAAVARSPAAQLFIQRARDASAEPLLTERNAASVAAICWRLDGLPLALELVATQARLLGPADLLLRLDRALEAGGVRDLPERQQTMRATLDWSCALLSTGQRTAFRRLSVFAGAFSLQAATAVCLDEETTGQDVLGLLGGLVEHSLVTTTPEAGGDGVRYGMLEPIRQYARDMLAASGEEAEIRSRHAAYYIGFGEEAGRALKRADQAVWHARLEWEHDSIRSALAWLLSRGEARPAAEIGWNIHRFWSLRGFTGEGRDWMRRALTHGDALDESTRARALYVVGMLSYVRGEFEPALEAVEASIEAARAGGDSLVLGHALLGRGFTALAMGDLARADDVLVEAVSCLRTQDSPVEMSLAQTALAQLALARGDHERTSALLDEAESLSRSACDCFSLTACLSNQALVARLRADDARATDLLRESVGLAGTLGDAWHVVFGLTGLASIAAAQGHAERAARLSGAVEGLCKTMGVSVPTAAWRELSEQALARARAMCGSERFIAARAQGLAMTLPEAVSAALTQSTSLAPMGIASPSE